MPEVSPLGKPGDAVPEKGSIHCVWAIRLPAMIAPPVPPTSDGEFVSVAGIPPGSVHLDYSAALLSVNRRFTRVRLFKTGGAVLPQMV